VNRNDFRKLAVIRLEDARILLRHGRFEGCFYLSGYAVECGLKACIAKLTKRHDFPDISLKEAYTHDLTKLLKIAGLEEPRNREFELDRGFEFNWHVVKEWKAESRYANPDRQQTESLFNAVADSKHGVLRWLKQQW
jgi:HEPN domain-containing protein